MALTKQEVIEPVSVVLVVTVQEELVSKLVANVGAFQTEEALSEKNTRAPPNAVARVAKLLDTTREVKVNVEGLPRDIKQDAVRVC